MTLYERFLRQAKEQIALQNLTQAEAGRVIGLSRNGVSKALRGEVILKGDKLLQLAMTLGISIDDIIKIQTPIRLQDAATLANHIYATDKDGHLYSAPLPRQPSGKTISFKAWKPFQPGELPTDGILLDEEKRLTANLYEHKMPFIHPCSICGQWRTCPNGYTTDAELCKRYDEIRKAYKRDGDAE